MYFVFCDFAAFTDCKIVNTLWSLLYNCIEVTLIKTSIGCLVAKWTIPSANLFSATLIKVLLAIF